MHELTSLRMSIDSLSCNNNNNNSHHVFRWLSLSRILAPDQSMTWFSFATWSVVADLLVSVANSFRSARVNVLLLVDSTSMCWKMGFVNRRLKLTKLMSATRSHSLRFGYDNKLTSFYAVQRLHSQYVINLVMSLFCFRFCLSRLICAVR